MKNLVMMFVAVLVTMGLVEYATVEVVANTVKAEEKEATVDVAKEEALKQIKALCDNAMLRVEEAAFNCDCAFDFSCAVGELNIWSLGMNAFAIHNKAHTNALSYERDYKHMIDAVETRVAELRAIYA